MAVIKGVRLKELRARVDAANRSMVTTAALTYVDVVRRMMRDGSKSGHWYHKADGRMHHASAPGEAPAVDYGVLVRNLAVDAEHIAGTGWVATAGVKAGEIPAKNNYPLALEYGSQFIEPRPAWRPAFPVALELARKAIESQSPRDTGAALTGTGPAAGGLAGVSVAA